MTNTYVDNLDYYEEKNKIQQIQINTYLKGNGKILKFMIYNCQ